MKEMWNWVVKNFANLFTVIGIILTIYLSIFYVPGYIKENENEKIKNINSDLIDNIQEIIYNEYELDYEQINSLIKGKEIRYRLKYTYSIDELLVQTEEAFMTNRFIPLGERVRIVGRIDSLRTLFLEFSTQNKTISDNSKEIENNTGLDYFTTMSMFISILIGIFTTSIGSLSFFKKIKNERKHNIEQQLENEKENIESRIISSIQFEKQIRDILIKNNLEFSYMPNVSDKGFDFNIRIDQENRLGVIVKFISDRNILSRFEVEKLFYPTTRTKYPSIIIINKPILNFKELIERYSKRSEKIHLIMTSELSEIESEIKKYISMYELTNV